ncbi:MAG: ATP-binding protein [Candidatus Zixiibacteriota bacterium]
MEDFKASTIKYYYRDFSLDYATIFNKMLGIANLGLPRAEFLSCTAKMLLDLSGCDFIEIRKKERKKLIRIEACGSDNYTDQISIISMKADDHEQIFPCLDETSDFEQICADIANGQFVPELPFYTKQGSFFVGDTDKPFELSSKACKWAGGRTIRINGEFRSLVVIGFQIDSNNPGLVIFKSKQKMFFSQKDVAALEEIAKILGMASSHRRAQEALRERIKEITCLYEIVSIAARPNISMNEIIEGVLKILPPGWFYPDIATARITIDGKSYALPDFKNSLQSLSAEIKVKGKNRGKVEVAYTKNMQELDEGPFIKEERSLINAIADELAQIIERYQIQEEQKQLREQLQHADRLATIGQLAAGVAHELNEPLSSILGFAQLANNNLANSKQIANDLEKIESASLHAREVVKKLVEFAHQKPQQKSLVNLSQIVDEGLYFLESRCAKSEIKLIRQLKEDLPEIYANKSQLYQVLTNLIVNAIQALPSGGTITITTDKCENGILLTVSDTGTGIEEEIIDEIFNPFFTTKDIDEGTGLGLAVVHGIIAANKGTIRVESTVGCGTKFDIFLPIGEMKQ